MVNPVQTQQAIFSVRNLSFSWPDGKQVFANVNLDLFPRQSLSLTGRNGSGKTTLFRCITGLLTACQGEIIFRNRALKKGRDFNLLRRTVGFVLQDAEDQLFFPSVIEDLVFGPLNIGLSSHEADTRAMEALDLLGCADLASRQTHELSGGEKKLVAMAAILSMRPEALLLDEPFAGLDQQAITKVTSVLQNLTCAKIIISHEPELIAPLCHGGWILEDGALLPATS